MLASSIARATYPVDYVDCHMLQFKTEISMLSLTCMQSSRPCKSGFVQMLAELEASCIMLQLHIMMLVIACHALLV